MIDTIRSILSDVASGSIKDAKIVQLAGEVERLNSENVVLRAERDVLKAQVSDLEFQVKILQPPERIEEEAEKVLNYVYDNPAIFPRRRIETGLGLGSGVANHCINVLLVRGFISVIGMNSGNDIMKITEGGMRYAQAYR